MKRWIGVALALFLSTTSSATAQTVTATAGAINGIVTDSTKAIIPGVTVTLSGPALMGAPTVVTDGNGGYRFSAVPPGDYTLTFELEGFRTVTRQDVHISIGFTATINTEMSPGAVSETVTVTGGSPVVDIQSTSVVTRFDAEKLATLPGSRDFFAVVAQAPAVSMARVDVGGSSALTLLAYTAYGLTSTTGVNRNEVEGIRVGAANGSNDMYYPDFNSFSEIAIKASGNSASMPVPGTLGQFVSKSGGNQYHGSVYSDYQSDAMQTKNIDPGQIAAGVSSGGGFDPTDLNRVDMFRDFSADLGGYVKKDKLWWYGAYRNTKTGQRYPFLIDDVQSTQAPVYTVKSTYNVDSRQKLVGYYQFQDKKTPNYFGPGFSTIVPSSALPRSVFPTKVWKAEYNATFNNAMFFEVRVGGYLSGFKTFSKSTDPRIVDQGANTNIGGDNTSGLTRNRPQANGALSYFKDGWAGSHTMKVGGEWMIDHLISPFDGYGNPCNCVSYLNNGTPTQVDLYLASNVSKNDLAAYAFYGEDSWQIHRRMTISLGLRLDRYVPVLPEQVGPAGQTFAEITPLTWSNWGPRVGVSTDLTGDGKTVLKANYGKFWVYPGVNFSSAFNPNPSGWFNRYQWNDLNTNGYWNPGEEGRLISVRGGSVSTQLDPDIENTFVQQFSLYLEREAAANFGVRTGFVWNGRRQVYGTYDATRPLSAYNAPAIVADPGPDGRVGTVDDGGSVTAYNLDPAALARTPVNTTTNLGPESDSDYYTWEVSATRRQASWWSLLASFANTWSRDTPLAGGATYSPNAQINSPDGVDRFTAWQAKVNATLNLPMSFRLVPMVRHQAGSAYGRTFVQRLNYGNATIKAEPKNAERTPNITVFDVRSEKTFKIQRVQLKGFFDVYNILNSNAEQELTTSSGTSWLRPTLITPPRVARVGVRVEW
jgi:hypothetical protein